MYYLKFRDSEKSVPNLMISSVMIPDESDNYLVEFWDVISNYYHLKDNEDVIIEAQNKLKTLSKDSEEYMELSKYISFQNKFKNKRKFIHKDEFNNMFEIISEYSNGKLTPYTT